MSESNAPSGSTFSEKALPSVPPPPAISWHIPEVDGVRALAMLMIYVYHVWEFGDSPTKILKMGGVSIDLFSPIGQFPSGVDLFMVLSGFCLFLPLCKSSEAVDRWNWKSYAIRRFRRIAPPYYAAIVYVTIMPFALTAFFHLLHKKANWQPLPSVWQFATHFTFTHTLFVSTFGSICGAFWSLGLEAQFYAVFPVVVFGFRRYGLRFLFAMIGISVIYRVAVSILLPQILSPEDTTQFDLRYFLPTVFFLGRWMQFAAGMLAAYAVAHHRKAGLTRNGRDGTIAILIALIFYLIAVMSNFS